MRQKTTIGKLGEWLPFFNGYFIGVVIAAQDLEIVIPAAMISLSINIYLYVWHGDDK